MQLLRELVGAPMDPARLIAIAIAAARALSEVHRAGTHGDVRPDTVYVDERLGSVRFAPPPERSGAAGREGGAYGIAAASLPYLAPERTGRIRRAADQRSDLYALGVVLYELLTGALPFEAEGVVEWVHCHIARRPRPLSEHAPRVPAPLAAIVMKLLAKMPEDRYQTAAALGRDLERCLGALRSGQASEPFPLGVDDVPEQLSIPHRLYGRDAEVAALTAALERVCEEGTPELVLVTGHPGIGKSALVDELHGPVVRRSGLLASGKADQVERGVPYAGVVQALDRLVQRLLMESGVRLTAWRRQILEAVGDSGQVILDLVPRMELVIGPQPPLSLLPGNETRFRFERVLRQLFEVLARREHPVVLFLDDLQWSDPASLSLLVNLLTHGDVRHLLVVGAYRDNEVGAAHPLNAALDAIKSAGIRAERISLGPLSRPDLERLCAGALRCEPVEAAPLAGLIHDRTAGNPFFATQFLRKLEEDGLIFFDRERLAFRWDLARISAERLTDDVLEMMIDRLRSLPEPTSIALRFAACIGGELEIDTLAVACDAPREGLHERLAPAVRSELLLGFGERYAFLHDRVQQAAYLLIPEAERAEVHLRIARSLAARTPPEERGDRLFAVVNQYNLGAARLSDPEERRAVAELNLAAGKRAKASSAYAVAAGYLAAGAALLDEESWRRDYELMYALHAERAECEHLSGDAEETRRLCALVIEHGRTKLDKQLAYRLLIERNTAELAIDKAVLASLECLALLGIELPRSATAADVEEEFRKVWEALGDRPIEVLLDLPPMADPELEAALAVLTITFVPAWYLDETLAHMLMGRTLYLSIVHGKAAATAMNYATASMVLIPRFRDYRRGYELGRVGYELARRDGDPYWLSMISTEFGAFSAVWFEPVARCIRYAREGLEAAQRAGNVTWITLGCMHTLSLLMSAGHRLDEVHRESERLLEVVSVVDRAMGVPVLLGIQRAVQCLRGLTADLATLNGGGFDEEAFEQANPPSSIVAYYYYHARKLQARFFAGEIADAVRVAERLKPVLWMAGCHVLVAEVTLYVTLALLGHLAEVDPEQQRAYRAEIAANEELLDLWAEHCPANFLAMRRLVAAEVARVDGRAEDALRLYDQAAAAARPSGLVYIEALSKELAGRSCLDRGLTSIAGALLGDARACYARWGADGKVRQIERLYGELLTADAAPSARSTTGDVLDQLDVLTAVKACQAISSQIDQGKLLSTLLQIVLEHAGAEACRVLVSDGVELAIAASARVGDDRIEVTVHAPHAPLGEAPLPASIIRYVERTRERVILDDPATQPLFSSDPYIQRARPRSVLCAPILRQSALAGVLYLENNLTLGAFSGRKLALLDLVTAQAAISMENASLYQELRRENAERRHTEGTLLEREERLRALLEERDASAAMLREKLELIERQQQAIRTLSTPLIEVWDGVLTMPVLGEIDAQTAAHMMEVLLEGVVRQQARHVILDLTAVQTIDTATADHVIRLVRAVQLLGSEGIVVGIRPEVAQTLVATGVDLSSVAKLANLRQALVRCMAKVKAGGARSRLS